MCLGHKKFGNHCCSCMKSVFKLSSLMGFRIRTGSDEISTSSNFVILSFPSTHIHIISHIPADVIQTLSVPPTGTQQQELHVTVNIMVSRDRRLSRLVQFTPSSSDLMTSPPTVPPSHSNSSQPTSYSKILYLEMIIHFEVNF